MIRAITRVMGVVNRTPDSFSSTEILPSLDESVSLALRHLAQGAELLDIGGESTRPGATPVSAAEELDRVIPLIRALRPQTRAIISIDTMKPAVARAACDAGADMWNDVTALTWAEDSLATAAELGCQVVLMHMQGRPRTMQAEPTYNDPVAEVGEFLVARAQAAEAAGVARSQIWLDPGIGFGKSLNHNLALLAGLDRLTALGHPVLLGVSRKRFVQAVDLTANDPADRLGGSLAAALAGARAGVAAVRAHDVRQTVQALTVDAAIRQAQPR